MQCPNCQSTESGLSFKLPRHLQDIIIRDFIHHNSSYTWNKNILHTTETASNDLVDFLREMNLDSKVFFKAPYKDWLSLDRFDEYRHSSWLDDLIESKNIQMYFQPIIASNGKIYAYEMLARFFDDEGTIIYPDKVFPAAKLRGRTFALDRLCRMQGVRQVKRLYDHQKAFINFIPTAIYEPEYCLRTTTALAESLSIESSRFIFEVVETEKVDDVEHLKSILTYYQNHGFNYALDDVGSGYNTLGLLDELKPPYIKLDMTVTQGVSRSTKKQAIASAFLSTAKKYGALCLAEGIEDIKDFKWLKEKGYDLFQGYLFGKPLPDPLEEKVIDLNQF
jgi:EAL domain-containing protein (putative c-di-GMP-specific phosphodiesterase class I)